MPKPQIYLNSKKVSSTRVEYWPGERIELTCLGTDDVPPKSTVVWRIRNEPTWRMHFSKIALCPTTYHNGKLIYCTIENNKYGSTESDVIKLVLKDPPSVKIEPNGVKYQCNVGQKLKFTCIGYNMRKNYNLEWYKQTGNSNPLFTMHNGSSPLTYELDLVQAGPVKIFCVVVDNPRPRVCDTRRYHIIRQDHAIESDHIEIDVINEEYTTTAAVTANHESYVTSTFGYPERVSDQKHFIQSSSSSTPTLIWSGAVAVVVLIVIAVGVLYLRKRKIKENSKQVQYVEVVFPESSSNNSRVSNENEQYAEIIGVMVPQIRKK